MENDKWLAMMYNIAGEKTAIRLRPRAAVKGARGKYGYLLVVTHHLAVVRADGMPDADYNDSLLVFDCELIQQLELGGRVVVIETCAGKRIYYAYVADEIASKDRATQVLLDHGHLSESNFRGGADLTWEFYSQYMEGPGAGADPSPA
jgi:Family of unknown function (DUF695)